MKKEIEEFLTFEIYQRDGKMFLHVPIANLKISKFNIEKSNLLIEVENNFYSLNHLNDRVVKYIIDGNAYLVESLDQLSNKQHLITL